MDWKIIQRNTKQIRLECELYRPGITLDSANYCNMYNNIGYQRVLFF